MARMLQKSPAAGKNCCGFFSRMHEHPERIMGVSSVSGGGYSQSVDPNELFKSWADRTLRSRGDQAAISDEGRAKAEELAKVKRDAGKSLPGAEHMEDARAENAAGGEGASSARNTSPEDQAKDLEGKIKALMSRLMQIMQSALPPDEKMQQAQPIQQAISQLQTQLNELTAQMMKGKAA
jgi:hypothetical protein